MQDLELIAQLLYEAEGDSLDFKQAQYRFAGASEEEQSELLKDILAFSNSWRRSSAFILVGVKDGKGSRAEVLGIEEHIDDARLQQFINGRTNRPVEFHYRPVGFEGKQIGLIQIPVQRRPLFIRKDFGKVKGGVVYIRRGSSTAIANPDEVAQMGAVFEEALPLKEPKLESFVALGETLVKGFSTKALYRHIPKSNAIPDFEKPRVNFGGIDLGATLGMVNYDFYREYAQYLQQRDGLVECKLVVSNKGSAPARDVKMVIEIPDENGVIRVVRDDRLVKKPSRERNIEPIFSKQKIIDDLHIEKRSVGWKLTYWLGKIQAQDAASSCRTLYIGAAVSSEVMLSSLIFSDDLSEPVKEQFKLDFIVEQMEMLPDDVKGEAR
jgi:hypothetical protein